VAFLHALLVIAAFVGVAAIPCALGLLIISFDETIGKISHALRRSIGRLFSRGRGVQDRSQQHGQDRSQRDHGQGHGQGGRIARGIRRVAQAIGGRLLRGRLRNRWLMARLAMSVRVGRKLEHSEPAGPPIQQVAADLRRLNRQRLSIAMRSRVWFQAVQHAYDDRLGVACRQLAIEEHLGELTGMDLDLERIRVEGRLEEAGLAIRDDSTQPRHWQL
jgi:hypothetical protein